MLATVKLVAEPWDVGLGGYQVGSFPSQWSEWNDRYRQTHAPLLGGEGNLIGDVGRRMTGSADMFDHDARSPRASINHVTVHDGFTLADLYAYNAKHNEANGEDNRDGSNDNLSTNCGHEGPTDDPAILALRRQLRKNQLACLMLAQGVPLLLAGDEVGNSQGGNNNAYCQDNEIGWVDWSNLGIAGRRHDRLRRPAHLVAQALSRSSRRVTGCSGKKAGWLVRRAVADAAGERDDGSGLEFSGGPVSGLRARRGRQRPDTLYRVERGAAADRIQPAETGRTIRLEAAAQHCGRSDQRVTCSSRQSSATAAPRSVIVLEGAA